MIYPVLDEMTLDANESKMKPYYEMLEHAIKDYCRKNHVKLPPSITMKAKADVIPQDEEKK
jgi:hypothetical protein